MAMIAPYMALLHMCHDLVQQHGKIRGALVCLVGPRSVQEERAAQCRFTSLASGFVIIVLTRSGEDERLTHQSLSGVRTCHFSGGCTLQQLKQTC